MLRSLGIWILNKKIALIINLFYRTCIHHIFIREQLIFALNIPESYIVIIYYFLLIKLIPDSGHIIDVNFWKNQCTILFLNACNGFIII